VRQPGKKLEIWKHHKFGVEVEIRFDQSTGAFWAYLGDERIGSNVLEEVRNQLRKKVEEQSDIAWIALMQVDASCQIDSDVKVHHGPGGGYSIEKSEYADDSDNGKNIIELEYERYWVAWVGNKWMKCEDWDAPEIRSESDLYDRRWKMSSWDSMRGVGPDITFPYTMVPSRNAYHDEPVTYLPYSQSLWDSLLVIGAKMGDLARRIESLLSTDEGRARLETAMSGLLLPAPSEEEDPDSSQ
jgi:hypothetical protein